MKRENQKLEYIWEAIIGERNYQDMHKGRDGKNEHDIPGWILIIKKQLDSAAMEWLEGDIDKSLTEVLQATAVGFACLQQHGVPDVAIRETGFGKVATDIPLEEFAKGSPLETVTVADFEEYKVYRWHDMLLVRTSDMPLTAKALDKFMKGQTRPFLHDQEPNDFIYLHDFKNFLAGGKLFWD